MLKLAALDEDDLKIVSAHVQDAVIRVGDMRWDKGARRFLLEINRFAWESPVNSVFNQRYERRRSVLHFEGVQAVRASGITRDKVDDVLVLLSIRFTPEDAPAGTIELIFAGDHALRLQVDYVEGRLTDLGAAWEAGSKPAHFG
ncbi:DUF2948 family protein [Tianweitania populi]|uniref:DUF2948 family protein n=1 Tax=Tianweitania populi TaxID=1607949 RepID=A0A8J3DQ64_9HYPH|nr:DUF2948 family protein [Tianweitania populi]GHD14578.1 hypothetical protein GCM10016234_20300 [Tianweitania populi]